MWRGKDWSKKTEFLWKKKQHGSKENKRFRGLDCEDLNGDKLAKVF